MEFNWDEFKNDYIAVHCNTEYDLNDFLNKCKENDIELCAEEYLNKELAYIIDDDNFLRRCQINGLVEEGFDIIEWEMESPFIENKIDYDREYNILEIMQFPEGIEFIDNMGCKVKFENSYMKVWSNATLNWGKCKITKNWLGSKFKMIKKDKKVSFEEAIQAYLKSKDIKCIWNDETTIYSDGFLDSDNDKLTMGQIVKGEWYIKED
ncbi:hypothetical protein ACP49_09295 [Clostridium botulinum]|nr:hypothetical protein ACP53_04185 [Clostridium botulinum]KON01600.1 hypothetical protein ACP49_09295 [Clostridium botulinum]MBY7003540.1 hypothetical protein [Clostridium botulinum]NFH93144.1 hypothetical protein [Clostridium botulinum]NFH96918.1 hypothetical protein [Clostridium botulinum]